MTGIIYGLIDGNTLQLRYVGQTTKSLKARLRGHKRRNSSNTHLNNWIKSRPISIIALEYDPVDLNEAEMCWISDLRAAGVQLLNIADGGRGRSMRNYKLTVEHRAKISAALAGKASHKQTPETRAKISATNKGRKLSTETRAKMMGNQNRRHVFYEMKRNYSPSSSSLIDPSRSSPSS